MRKVLAVLLMLLPSLGLAVDREGEGQYIEGVVQAIDLPKSQMLVQGYRFWVPHTTPVSIAGSYGAFTMLKSGMRVAFTFRTHDDGIREVLELEEVVSDRELELL